MRPFEAIKKRCGAKPPLAGMVFFSALIQTASVPVSPTRLTLEPYISAQAADPWSVT